ncbi:MAG: putative toxin-antitoxin system toxin component, PIN family [Betaproteobacteria bacterium]|jgi:putative PIN family toxin of toxin-antitoxin system
MRAESGLPLCYRQVVVDTNVIISAALSPHGASALLLKRVLLEGQVVLCAATFAELETRLWRPKFDPYFTLPDRQALLHDLASSAHWHEAPQATGTWCRDPDDDKFIALALATQVTRLITGDADLLCLDPLAELRLLTPRQALDELQTSP